MFQFLSYTCLQILNYKFEFVTFVKAIFLVPPKFLNNWVPKKIIKVSIICLLSEKFLEHYVIFVILFFKFSADAGQFLGGFSVMNELD